MPSFDDSFLMNHTCLRIKDPAVLIPYYVNNFGFLHLKTLDFGPVALYLLAHTAEGTAESWTARQGVLELCHHKGSELDPNFKLDNGNGDFKGFGHICVSVDNLAQCEQKLLSQGVAFQKKTADGRQKNIAFALDADNYWVELIEHGRGKTESGLDPATYRLNHTMIRVRDPKVSLDFYRNVLGFKLLLTRDFPDAKFTLYFLGYEHDPQFTEDSADRDSQAYREGVIELTYNYGTDTDADFKGYHSGNTDPLGYGHTCVSCRDPKKLCAEIDAALGDKADWLCRFDESPVAKGLAFLRDPDGYSVEIFGHDLGLKL